MPLLWKINSNWNQQVPAEITNLWPLGREQLPIFKKLRTPRKVIVTNPTEFQIHGYRDALQDAYGAWIYL